VILLAGPSGSGKSRLAVRSGLPILNLDDFYRTGDDPALPRFPSGSVDWDHPGSWHAGQAMAAVLRLCETGLVRVPRYDISANGPVGEQDLDLDGAAVFIAEGIFAAELVSQCRAAGVLRAAICVRRSRWVTMALRFGRDLREHRKPVGVLLRRGWHLAMAEPAIVRGLQEKGCDCRSPAEVERFLSGPTGSA